MSKTNQEQILRKHIHRINRALSDARKDGIHINVRCGKRTPYKITATIKDVK